MRWGTDRQSWRLRRLPGYRHPNTHGLHPATAAVLFLFPLWGILHPHAHTLAGLLPYAALGWLCLGAIAAGILRAQQQASFETLGRVFMPATDSQGGRRPLRASTSTSWPRGGM